MTRIRQSWKMFEVIFEECNIAGGTMSVGVQDSSRCDHVNADVTALVHGQREGESVCYRAGEREMNIRAIWRGVPSVMPTTADKS